MELLARIANVARATPERAAFLQSDGRRITYGALDRAIATGRAAASSRSPGQRVVVMQSGNVGDFAATFLGMIAAGTDVLLVPDSVPAVEVDALDRRASAATRIVGQIRGDLLLATSGSTGTPRIVRRTAASLDAVAANTVEAIGFREGDVLIAAVPLAHSYGLEHGLLAPLWAGATVALCGGLDIGELTWAAGQSPTIFPSVPVILERLAELRDALPGLAGVRAVYSAGAPLPEAVGERYVARYGTPIGQLYGSTEIGTVTYRPGDRGGGVGWPMRGVSVRIAGDVEVAIRSPSMFAGYLDGPAALVDDHFLTGDLGHLAEDGCLVLTGRARVLIDVGGLKVDPAEVEAVLTAHPAVAACAVVPLRQSETVCRLRALLVARDASAMPDVEGLRAFARERLAPHKVPRAFEWRADLPRSATGKLLRPMLDDI